jgi:hypothetical protein
MISWRKLAIGLSMDPWRFDPAAASTAANAVVRAGPAALSVLSEWVYQASDLEEAMAAVIAARIAVAPVPVYGRADTFQPNAPHLLHHPFVLSDDLPFLPASAFEGGGAIPDPATQIEACFRHGTLIQLLEPGEPTRAALALIASKMWDSLIFPDARQRASRIVRWQAVRAMGRAELLSGLQPSLAEDDQFERWWQSLQLPGF